MWSARLPGSPAGRSRSIRVAAPASRLAPTACRRADLEQKLISELPFLSLHLQWIQGTILLRSTHEKSDGSMLSRTAAASCFPHPQFVTMRTNSIISVKTTIVPNFYFVLIIQIYEICKRVMEKSLHVRTGEPGRDQRQL